MEPTLEVFGSQVVVVGSFNPPVLTPGWLEANKLIGSGDAEFAMQNESLAITPEISRFETEWFTVQILKQQFALMSKGPVTPALKDLLVGIFTLLPHTPVTAIGLNSIAHYRIGTTADYHMIGDVLAPKEIWNTFYPESKRQNVGLESITMVINPSERGVPTAATDRVKRITLSPSDKIKSNGIQIFLNDHFPILPEKSSKVSSCDMLLDITENHWQSSMNDATSAFVGILKAATAKGN
jgi:hypothetical protein